MRSTLNEDHIDQMLQIDNSPNLEDKLSIEYINQRIKMRYKTRKRGKYIKISTIVAGVFCMALIIPFWTIKKDAVHATLTPLGELTIVKQSSVQKTLKNMNLKIEKTSAPAKISAKEIVRKLARTHYYGTQKATSIEAMHCVISGVPKTMVNPAVIQSDPSIQVSGDYLNNVPVWIITFNGIHPVVHGGIGINIPKSKLPTAQDEIFDSNTGKAVIGFVSRN